VTSPPPALPVPEEPTVVIAVPPPVTLELLRVRPALEPEPEGSPPDGTPADKVEVTVELFGIPLPPPPLPPLEWSGNLSRSQRTEPEKEGISYIIQWLNVRKKNPSVNSDFLKVRILKSQNLKKVRIFWRNNITVSGVFEDFKFKNGNWNMLKLYVFLENL
jgi:hypothetical protein